MFTYLNCFVVFFLGHLYNTKEVLSVNPLQGYKFKIRIVPIQLDTRKTEESYYKFWVRWTDENFFIFALRFILSFTIAFFIVNFLAFLVCFTVINIPNLPKLWQNVKTWFKILYASKSVKEFFQNGKNVFGQIYVDLTKKVNETFNYIMDHIPSGIADNIEEGYYLINDNLSNLSNTIATYFKKEEPSKKDPL
jgi:hypothetical protein